MTNKTAAKSASGRTTATIEMPSSPDQIRNVALVGHSGVGKTTLLEALLKVSGELGHSQTLAGSATVSLAFFPARWRDHVVNFIDTPGSLDFAGELRAGLRAADAALFVLCATEQIEPATLALWEECGLAGMPRAIVVDRHEAAAEALASAVRRTAEVFGRGGSEAVPLFDDDPSSLIESVIEQSGDEELLERYAGGEPIEEDMLARDVALAMRSRHFFPVLGVDAASGEGLAQVLDTIVTEFPAPTDASFPEVTHLDGSPVEGLGCDSAGPLVAEVVRTTIDPYVGRLCVLRVFSGTLDADTPIHVSGHSARVWGEDSGHTDHDVDERLGALYSPLGATLRPVTRVVAGDLCAIGRLDSAETGDTVSAKTQPLLVAPWPMPEPLLPIAVLAPTRNDEDALAKALARLAAADPSVRIERPGTGQLVLWCLGEAHAELVLQRLRGFGAQVETEPVRVALLQTFVSEARGHGRLVKQSGGHGQFAVCDVVVTPLPRGSGVEFAEKVVGGAVPNNFIGSVEKGVLAQLAAGLDDRRIPVTDVRVTLVDGKAHSVDSSDAAFQLAGALALRDAAAAAGLALLEPLSQIEVNVPDAYVGAVMSDLSGRRGRVCGSITDSTAPSGMERTTVTAEVPDSELLRYAASLRGLCAGAGRFTRRYSRHDVVPASVAATLGSGA